MNEKLILTIMDKFSSGSIGELDLDDGTSHLKLRKAGLAPPPEAAAQAVGFAAAGTQETVQGGSRESGGGANQAGQKQSADAKPVSHEEGEKITSPIVATYYASPSPDAPAFVTPGSKVKTGQTLCILEAMKMMNHLVAEFDCEIIRSHAANGDMVEYGQTLFTVKRL